MRHLIAAAKAAHKKHKQIGKINQMRSRGRAYYTKQKLKEHRFNAQTRNTKRRPF